MDAFNKLNTEQAKEILNLKELLARESTHKQYDKHIRCFFVWIFLSGMALLRGSKSSPSFVGLRRCSVPDWAI